MRTARLTLLGFALALLGACGAADLTAPETDDKVVDPPVVSTQGCGYLGSAGCP